MGVADDDRFRVATRQCRQWEDLERSQIRRIRDVDGLH